MAQAAELLVRGAAAGAFVLLGLGVVRQSSLPVRLTGCLFCLAAAAHTLTQSPIAFGSLDWVAAPAWVLSVAAAGLFWAFAIELFGDNRTLAFGRLVPAGLLLVPASMAILAPLPVSKWLWLAQNVISAALMLHVLVVVWTGWRGDLVEARRRLRGPLLGVAALYGLMVVGAQSAELFMLSAGQLSMVAAASLLAMALAGSQLFLRADPALFGSPVTLDRSPSRPAPPQALPFNLLDQFDEQEIWREEGLTIRAMAARLSTPEYLLRRLINEGLGYRNFAAFINERRIDAAKQALADPDQVRISIAAIAFEVGFGSLGPFNRAFRENTGQSPTEWRKAFQTGEVIGPIPEPSGSD